VFSFFKGDDPDPWEPDVYWYDAIQFPGGKDMRHLFDLVLSRSFERLIPDRDLLVTDAGYGKDHVESSRADDRSFALIYLPYGKTVEVDLNQLSGKRIKAFWFNPLNGKNKFIGTYTEKRIQAFTAPTSKHDWVLVLDDASKGFSDPGKKRKEP